jgi:hypothetical protein
MTARYYASFVSGELAGSTSPNIISFYAATDGDAEAAASALAALLSADYMSLTKSIGGSQDRSTYPTAGRGSEGMMLLTASGYREHAHFNGCSGSPKAGLLDYIDGAGAGKLLTFQTGAAVVDIAGAKR